jgi:hypothetical protein
MVTPRLCRKRPKKFDLLDALFEDLYDVSEKLTCTLSGERWRLSKKSFCPLVT